MVNVEAKNLKDQYDEVLSFHLFSLFKFPENFISVSIKSTLYFLPFNFYIPPTTFVFKLTEFNQYCQICVGLATGAWAAFQG